MFKWIKNIFKKKPAVKQVDPFWNADRMKKIAGVNDPEPLGKLREVGYIYTNPYEYTNEVIQSSSLDDTRKFQLLKMAQDWRQDTNTRTSVYEGCTYTGNPILVDPKPCDSCMPSCLDSVQLDVKKPR
jgi:hypothetical protein